MGEITEEGRPMNRTMNPWVSMIALLLLIIIFKFI